MNDNLNPTPTPPMENQSGNTPAAFCQQCGRPLTPANARVVGPSVFCEPCLADRLGVPSATQPPPPGYAPVQNPAADPAYQPQSVYPPSAPNPGLATLLGFIPGVGAMYNEQYVKGIVHLIVFVVLIMLTEINGLFGLFIAGWEFYMAIEAHHTAKARRDGLPLPNPFGLNDIGERLGFGKSQNWGQPGNPFAAATEAARAAAQQASAAAAEAYATQPHPDHAAAQQANYFAQQAAQAANMPANPYPSPNWADTYAAPPMPPTPIPTYDPLHPTLIPPPAPLTPLSRFPTGAVWLIGLGCVFLLATTGIFQGIRGNTIVGLALMALGVWIFIRRMDETGPSLHDDGSPNYRFRLVRACRGAFWLFFIGLWLLLESFHILRFEHTWPLFLIFLGVLALLERVAYNSAAAAPLYGAPATPPVPAPTPDQKAGN